MPFRFQLLAAVAAIAIAVLVLPPAMQAQSWHWVREGNGSSNDVVDGSAIDTLGNLYVVGTFEQNIAFGSTIFTNGISPGLYLVKYNSGGVFQWAISGLGSGAFLNTAVAVSRLGDVFITGTYTGTVRIGSDTLRSVGGTTEAFVGRYNPDGTRRWLQRAALGNGGGWGRGISTDNTGNCYATGYFTDTVAFDTTTIMSTGGTDAFIAKYDRNGAVLWVSQLGGPGNDRANGVGVDGSGNSYIGGSFTDSVIVALDTAHAAGGADGFVARFSPTGSPTWITPISGLENDVVNAIAVDAFGNVNITGAIVDSVMIDTTQLVTAGGTDAFVARIDGVGALRWAHAIGSDSADAGQGITVDQLGSVYVTGYVSDTTWINGLVLPIIPNNADVFVVKYTGAGVAEWERHAGGAGFDEGRTVVADRANELRVSGMFSDTIQLVPFTSVAVGAQDVFIGKLGADPTITPGLIVEDRLCAGDQFQIPFTVKGVFGAGNYFVAELSDSTGSFANPVEIGRIFGIGGTTIVAKIPPATLPGKRYRVRVNSTVPVVIGPSNSTDIAIDIMPTPVVTPAGPITICQGDSVVLDAGEGYPTYVWNNGDRTRRTVIKQSGEYAVTATNSVGCIGTSQSVVVRVITAAPPTITRTGNTLESSPAIAYQWILGGAPLSGANERILNPAQDGIYQVVITDSNGCRAISQPITFARGAGVEMENVLAGVAVYPHPNTGIFTVRFPNNRAGRVQVNIVNALGSRVAGWDEQWNGGEYSRVVDIRTQPAGVYFIRIESPSGNWTGEVVKR